MNNSDVKLLRRGASVQQLTATRVDPPMLPFEEMCFAETFTTSAKLKKICDNDEVTEAASLFGTVKELVDLKNRSTSSLTLERLVKKFCHDYELLERHQREAVLLHLATKYYINEKDLKSKAQEITQVNG